MFKGQNFIFFERLVNLFQKKTCVYGDIITKQGDFINDLYLIKSGQFSVEYTYENSVINNFGIRYFSQVNHERFSQTRMYEISEKIAANEHLKVSIIIY